MSVVTDKRDFQNLISEANQHPFTGWDWSFISERTRVSALPWDYPQRVCKAFACVQTMLDMGTGGGEFLSSLQPLPPHTYATESYPPNVPIAKTRLEPMGIHVISIKSHYHLPFSNDFFNLIINRHANFIAEEVARILKCGGRFITEQVGERDLLELNERLQSETKNHPSSYHRALTSVRGAGFEIVESREAFRETMFYDVGAIVYLLKAIPWQVPDFSIEKYHDKLRAIHNHIQTNGQFVASGHRYYIEARKP